MFDKGGFVAKYGPRKGEYIRWSVFEFAHFIDMRINTRKTGETPEQAADAIIVEYERYGLVKADQKELAIKEFRRWQET